MQIMIAVEQHHFGMLLFVCNQVVEIIKQFGKRDFFVWVEIISYKDIHAVVFNKLFPTSATVYVANNIVVFHVLFQKQFVQFL